MKENLKMRTPITKMTTRLLALTCSLILSCSVLANAQETQRAATAIQIGTVIPQGRDFRVEFNEDQLSKLYPQYPAMKANARRSQPAGQEEFRQLVLSDVLRKIRTLFPTGIPEGAAGKIKISVTVKLTKPPEFGLSVEW
jgi:hypothetical protein